MNKLLSISYLILCLSIFWACTNEKQPVKQPDNTTPPKNEQTTTTTPSTTPQTPKRDYGPDQYKLVFRTGCHEEAGTDAKMYVKLYGTEGESEEFLLDNKLGTEFESCSTDEFILPVGKEKIGDLERLNLRHDNSGDNPSFLVEIVYAYHMKTMKKFGFACGKWFAKDLDDGKIERMFFLHRECK